jgi:hypothetical protein
MPVRAILVMVLLAAAAAQTPVLPYARDALALGRTRDDALFESFNKGYSLAVSDIIEAAEIITEFRRAVLLVRERTMQGDYVVTDATVTRAMAPHLGRIGFIVQVRLSPFNTFINPPAYDVYVSTGARSKPLADKSLKREPVYALGPPGSPIVGVRIHVTFSKEEIERAAQPELIVTDDKAEIIWRARIDLSRFR